MISQLFYRFFLRRKGLVFGRNLRILGKPIVTLASHSEIRIGNDVTLSSRSKENAIGINHEVVIRTQTSSAHIIIGNNVRMSGASICARENITIGNDVLIGANVVIADSDLHSLDATERRAGKKDIPSVPVHIGNDVWIGADCYIGKGVTIGDNVVIGAKSVVTKSIPANCVAAGVPCRVIREI